MKKMILIVAALMMFAATQAQEASKNHFLFEMGLGNTTLGNYPAVSVFGNDEESYNLCPTSSISLGYVMDNFMVGLTYNLIQGYTPYSAAKETFALSNLMLDLRQMFELGHNFGFEIGVALGAGIATNHYEQLSEKKVATRYGFTGQVFTGLNYHFAKHSDFGLRLTLPTNCMMMGDVHNGPAMNSTDNRSVVNGYSLQVLYRFNF